MSRPQSPHAAYKLHGARRGPVLTAMRFHGRLFVVEGNQRLFALRDAGMPCVWVEIGDFHFSVIQSHE